jgi:Sigma-70, region 4
MAAAGTGALNHHMITWNGKTQSAKQWAAEIGGIAPQKLLTRVQRVEKGEAVYDLDRAMDPTPLERGWSAGANRREPVRAEMLQAFDVPYWADDWAWYVVEHHRGDGLTLDEIGQFYGLTRESIRKYEASALRKFRQFCELRGIAADLRGLLRALDEMRVVNTNAFEEEE